VTLFTVWVGGNSDTTSPVIMDTPEVEEEMADVGVVTGTDPKETLVACSALALARALERPAGEQPTKSGAVSLTASHSCLLN